MQTMGRILACLGRDQHPVDQIRLQPRLGGTGHDQHLIDVGHQKLLAAPGRPAETTLAGLDAVDDSLVGPGSGHRPEEHPVAGGHHVAQIGGHGLQQPPGDALVDRAIFGLNAAGQAIDTENPAAKAGRFVNLQQTRLAIQGRVDDHRPSPRNVAPAADPLIGRSLVVVFRFLVADELPCPVARPGSVRAVLAEVDADLFLFRHSRVGFSPPP